MGDLAIQVQKLENELYNFKSNAGIEKILSIKIYINTILMMKKDMY